MAIRRTHTQQKSQVQMDAIKLTYSLPTTELKKSESKLSSESAPNQYFFGYPTTYIYRDIVKTIVISLITLGMLALITFRTRFF